MGRQKVAIIGTGSLACIFAARLCRVADVTMTGSWQMQVDAINRSGLTVMELDGSTSTATIDACLHHQLSGVAKADIVLVLVKSYQTQAAVERIRPFLKARTVVLTLQNGLGHQQTLQSALPDHIVSAGVTMQGSNLAGVGRVVHAGNGATIVDEALTGAIGLLRSAQIPVQTPAASNAASIDEAIWRKLIINSAVNPLTALLGQTNGFLAVDSKARQLCEATAIETARVAIAAGVWPEQGADAAASLVTAAAQTTSANRSSMLQDISRGNRTEIDSICGQVVLHAQQCGVVAPYNALWLQLVQAAEAKFADAKAGAVKRQGSEGRPLYDLDTLSRWARP